MDKGQVQITNLSVNHPIINVSQALKAARGMGFLMNCQIILKKHNKLRQVRNRIQGNSDNDDAEGILKLGGELMIPPPALLQAAWC